MEIPRDEYLNELKRKEGNGLVKIVTGLRRCGKSYLLFNIFRSYLLDKGVKEDHILAYSLDNLKSRRFKDPEVLLAEIEGHIGESGTYYVLLDEIQMVDDFEPLLASLMQMPGVDVYVTGSNSRFLSHDVITAFRGRGDEIRLHPLTFREFLPVCGLDEERAWKEYALYGGLPYLTTLSEGKYKAQYLTRLFEEVYLKDIKERLKLRRPMEMGEIMDILASGIGTLTSPDKIAKTMKSVHGKSLSANTVLSYVQQLENAFLISRATRFDIKGRRYVGQGCKWYFEDLGLRNARLNFRQQEENHLMENAIYNELKARGYQVDIGIVDRFEEGNGGKRIKSWLEVDFVVNNQDMRCYIQSAYAMQDSQKQQQETKSLKGIADSFRKIIVTKDVLKRYWDDDGFLNVGLLDFLLDRGLITG